MKVVVLVGVFHIVVDHNKAFLACFGNPLQAGIDTEDFRHVVVLKQAYPIQVRGKGILGVKADKPCHEITLRQFDVIQFVAAFNDELLPLPAQVSTDLISLTL